MNYLKILGLLLLTTIINTSLQAQFVENGDIEFEVKTNIKKTMGNSSWAEMMKDKLPNFKTTYYKYSFSANKSSYQFDHWENKESIPEFLRQSDEKSVWFADYNTGLFSMKKDVFGSSFGIKDSIKPIEWKLSNENRIIAGYNCRKATGMIMDSVYVFAFYTDEITIPGGPCTLHGLPGMILGMTIPRMYTSWIATKVNVSKTASIITAPADAKNSYTLKTVGATIKEKTKDWIDESDPESGKWLDQLIWNVVL